MVTLHEVITFLVSMQISISSLQTHNVNRCGRSRHLARKLSLRRKRSSPNVFEMAATETITSIILIIGRFNTSIPHAYSFVIGSKHITLNATGGGFLTASKQFRHGATSKSRSNTASNSTKHKSPHLSGWRQIISLIT